MKQRGETLFVAALLAFSAAALWESYGIAGFSKWSSPGVFPMLASAVMLVCSLFIYRDARKRGAGSLIKNESEHTFELSASSDDPAATQQSPPVIDATRVFPRRVVTITALLAVYVVAMPTLGFLLCSGLFLFISISYLWNKPLWLSLGVSMASLVVIHFLFRRVFQVVLPEGAIISLFL